jgi:hypothetical protein
MHHTTGIMRTQAIQKLACTLLSLGAVFGFEPVEAGTILTVDFSSGPTYQTTSSFIDESATVPRLGSARGAIDATLGVMKAEEETVPPRDSSGAPNGGFFQINDFLSDTYHLHGSNPGSTTIAVHLTAAGTMTLPAVDPQGDANGAILVLHPGNGGSGGASVSLTSNPSEVANGYTLVQPGTYPVSESSTFNVAFSGNQGTQLTFVMSLYGVGGVSLDFFSTAQISFDLPPGTSITSDGGFVQSASVPEPSTIVLVLSGLPIIVAGLRHCSKSSRTSSS